MASAGSPCEKKASCGANWMILRPRPALARKAAVSNPGFSSSTNEGPPSDCGPDKDDRRKHARFYWQMVSGSSSFDRASTPFSRQHTLPQTLAQNFTGGGGILFNFAHLYGNIFAPPRSHDPTMESDEAPGDPGDTAPRAISLRVSLRQTPLVQGEA